MKDVKDLIQESQGNTSAGDAEEVKVEQNSVETNPPKTDKSDYHASDEKTEGALEEKMTELRDKEFEDELKQFAQQNGIGYINLKNLPIPADTLQKIPLEVCETEKIVCFYFVEHKSARIATLEKDIEKLNALKEKYKAELKVEVEIFITSEKSLAGALKQYRAVPIIKPAPRGVEITGEDLKKFSDKFQKIEDIKEVVNSVSTTELVAAILAMGLKVDASDVHIEAENDGVKLRYRIDGVLNTACVLDKEIWQKLISRIKLLSAMKLNITTAPQDGRFSIFAGQDKIDVRASALPTNYGESVVMRLLLSKNAGVELEELGLSKKYFELLTRVMHRPNGMIITTGPTGSGKTTSLYAILNKLNSSENKIITIEDPIEYELKGVNQSQVDKSKDYTFAKGLKSIVRQDPDIILVGEMRDLETVDIGLNAALTGHLVLSTLHTNNAAGAIPRFLAMGAKPYLLAPALDLVIAQRLVRKLCDKCKEQVELSDEQKNKITEELKGTENTEINNLKVYKAVGCEECNKIGYKGRIGIFEMFEMNKEIEQVILSNSVSEYQISEIAIKNGMVTMKQDGYLKVLKGMTSLEEIERVAGE